jgi:hypothetical protein
MVTMDRLPGSPPVFFLATLIRPSRGHLLSTRPSLLKIAVFRQGNLGAVALEPLLSGPGEGSLPRRLRLLF